MIVEGIVRGHRDGHGFVTPDDGGPDVYLPPQQMRTVLHLDRVSVRVGKPDRRGRIEGQVIGILERSTRPIIGRLLQEGGTWLLAPEDRRYVQDILISPDGVGKARVGQVVSAQITQPPLPNVQPVGRVLEVLGELDDPGMEIEIAVRKYGVPHVLSPGALKESAALPDAVRDVDAAGRIDLRDVALVTIDGEDARDFDDAVYCEPTRIGRAKGWRLLVAIADVSHYVREGTELDADALERATSVYFPRRVIPMLPEKLSNGLCSLNPQVDRLCMVCDVLITAQGDMKAYQFYPAVMRSQARLTYTEVADILSNTAGKLARERAALVPHLLNLHAVFNALLQSRQVRGALDLDIPETQIVVNAAGKIEAIVPRHRNDAHRLIEECMLAANVCAAHFLESNKQLALYRVHEGPTPEKLETLRTLLRNLGLTLGSKGEAPEPADYQALAKSIEDRPDALQIQTLLLRSMQQAIYTPHNSGHFGLAYPAYTHFTSPIRRYPDLLTHRGIKAILQGQHYTPKFSERVEMNRGEQNARRAPQRNATSVAPAAPVSKEQAKDMPIWEAAGVHCSANERRADEASRDVESWLKCWYMRDKLGEEYAGTITAVTGFGLFVQLDALFVEGLVHVSEIGADYFRYDEARGELRGERTGIRYALGGRLLVQVSRVDLDGRKIDFRLVREGGKTNPSNKPLPTSGEIKGLDEDVFALNPQTSVGVRKSRTSPGTTNPTGKSQRRGAPAPVKASAASTSPARPAKTKAAAGRKTGKGGKPNGPRSRVR
ncbi:MAG: ribonuclease R [Thiomonas sp.]